MHAELEEKNEKMRSNQEDGDLLLQDKVSHSQQQKHLIDQVILIMSLCHFPAPFKMKIYLEFNLATWLRVVKFA